MLSKRLSGLVACGLLASSAAHAEGPKVGLDLRFDNEQSQYESKDKTANTKITAKDSKFYTTRVRLKVTGDLTAKTSYNFILSPVSDYKRGGDATGVDGGPRALKYASLRHKFSDIVALEVGKLGVNVLSIENDYSGYDWIFGSMINDIVYDGAAAGKFETAGLIAEGSETGAQLDLTFGDHVVSVQALNGIKGDRSKTATSDKNASNGSLSATVKYQGKIAGGMLEPLVSYAKLQHADRQLGNPDAAGVEQTWGKKDEISVYGVGTKINPVANLSIDLEHQGFDQAESKDQADAIVVQKWTGQGQVVKFQYDLPNPKISPFVKFTTDKTEQGKGDGKTKTEDTRWGLGVFFWPEDNSPIRFHAGYWQDALKVKVAGQTVSEVNGSTFNLGAGLKF